MMCSLRKEQLFLCKVSSGVSPAWLHEGKDYWNLYYLSKIHAILNETKESLRYLSEMEESSVLLYNREYIELSTLFSNIQNEPEFESIMKRYKAKNEAIRAQIKEMEERGNIDL